MPLNDRDYMKASPPPRRRVWTGRGQGDWLLNPVNLIIIINIIVFFFALARTNEVVGNLGLIPVLFTERPWTILTSMFVHEELWHILGNMLTLYFFGRVVYQMLGSVRFLLIYFIGGIIGNLFYVWLGGPDTLAIGASGAIYAMAGTLVVMMPRMRVAIWGIIPMPLWVMVLVFFVLWSAPGVIPGLAWQAHLGGLLVGLIAGFYFRKTMRYIYYH